jgi:hypothetical protein
VGSVGSGPEYVELMGMDDNTSPALNIVQQRVQSSPNEFLIAAHHGDCHDSMTWILKVSDLGNTQLKTRPNPLSYLGYSLTLILQTS